MNREYAFLRNDLLRAAKEINQGKEVLPALDMLEGLEAMEEAAEFLGKLYTAGRELVEGEKMDLANLVTNE